MTRKAKKSTFLTNKIILGIAGAGLALLIIFAIFLSLRPNAELIIITAPAEATIRLDGHRIKNGSREVRAGKHTIELSLEGLETKTKEIEISPKETKSLNLYLTGEGENFSHYLKNEEDIELLAVIGDERATDFVSSYYKAKSINEILPLTIVKDYGEANSRLELGKDCERSYCLKITDEGAKLKDEMLAKIKTLGYDPEDYEIQYELVGGENEE